MPAPSSAAGLRDVLVGVAVPAVGLFAVNLGVGLALRRIPDETPLVRGLQRRSPLRDRVAKLVSTTSDVPASVALAAASVPLLLAARLPWRQAIKPALAMGLETAVYVAAGALVDRPRPAVERLDHDQPTSSFPSGHVGATVALTVVVASLAGRLPSPTLRRLVRAGCLAYPAVLAPARVYVGMHYPSDVLMGVLNGLACGRLALDWDERKL